MEAEKRPSPDSSANEEGDRAALDHYSEEEDSARRSYGCTFCKRGFTNAQALGGHMNIHRKDRVKGKGHLNHHHHQVPVSSLNNGKKPSSDADNGRNNPDPIGGEGSYLLSQYTIMSQAHRGITDHNKVFQIPAANPCSPKHKRNFTESDFAVRSSQSLGRNDCGHMDDGLSLRIGLSASSNCNEPKVSQKQSEIDLELRLGRDP